MEPDGRRYPRHALVGVGAILLDRPVERVLLVRRGAPPALGLWTFPGGLVSAGESLRAACAREVLEETGLAAELLEPARVVERILRDAEGRVEYHYLIVDFLGRAEGDPMPSSDAADARWVFLDEAAGLPLTRGVAAALGRALDLARGRAPSLPLFE